MIFGSGWILINWHVPEAIIIELLCTTCTYIQFQLSLTLVSILINSQEASIVSSCFNHFVALTYFLFFIPLDFYFQDRKMNNFIQLINVKGDFFVVRNFLIVLLREKCIVFFLYFSYIMK